MPLVVLPPLLLQIQPRHGLGGEHVVNAHRTLVYTDQYWKICATGAPKGVRFTKMPKLWKNYLPSNFGGQAKPDERYLQCDRRI